MGTASLVFCSAVLSLWALGCGGSEFLTSSSNGGGGSAASGGGPIEDASILTGGGGSQPRVDALAPPIDGALRDQATCVPITCAQQNAKCGMFANPCGGDIDCGVCDGGYCQSANGTFACAATPCSAEDRSVTCTGRCYKQTNNCGSQVDCGGPSCDQKVCGDGDGCGGYCTSPCPGGQSCIGAPPKCCMPNCAGAGACGAHDGCGGYCTGACPASQICTGTPPACAPCNPLCEGSKCGDPDGCNGQCAYGSCPPGQVCGANNIPNHCGTLGTCAQPVACSGCNSYPTSLGCNPPYVFDYVCKAGFAIDATSVCSYEGMLSGGSTLYCCTQ